MTISELTVNQINTALLQLQTQIESLKKQIEQMQETK